MWLDKEINVQDASTEPGSRENTKKDSLSGLLLHSNHLTSSFGNYMHFCYFCPESSFKCRTVERKNVACERASMTNEFRFSSRILIRMPYRASCRVHRLKIFLTNHRQGLFSVADTLSSPVSEEDDSGREKNTLAFFPLSSTLSALPVSI